MKLIIFAFVCSLSTIFLLNKINNTYAEITAPVPIVIYHHAKPIIAKQEPKHRPAIRYAIAYQPPPSFIETIIEQKARAHPRVNIALFRAIGFCESHWVIKATNQNSDGTMDGGLMQINDVHLPELATLGLDRFDLADSIEFAMILIERNGTADYRSSQKCWSKIALI